LKEQERGGSACLELPLFTRVLLFRGLKSVPGYSVPINRVTNRVTVTTIAARFVAFHSHWRFEAVFCNPGKEHAHEKGGIEGEASKTHAVLDSNDGCKLLILLTAFFIYRGFEISSI
jgi:hypothetical protein